MIYSIASSMIFHFLPVLLVKLTPWKSLTSPSQIPMMNRTRNRSVSWISGTLRPINLREILTLDQLWLPFCGSSVVSCLWLPAWPISLWQAIRASPLTSLSSRKFSRGSKLKWVETRSSIDLIHKTATIMTRNRIIWRRRSCPDMCLDSIGQRAITST